MSFLVTARKYRPSSFHEVVAQEHVVQTLLNAIRMNRIAHAYLFCGPRGVGKTTTARIFAKALNCPNAVDGEPCNTCVTCVEISEGRSIDVMEIDGASNNGVDQVRTIRDAVRFMPARDKYKMYIIDEVHMLTKEAFNALLKTLEEPPAHALFVFATTEPHKLLPTVVSRCQRYDFKRMQLADIVGQLRRICGQEGITADDAALFTIAKKGDGSMRDAESIFDQVVAYAGNALTVTAVQDVLHTVDDETYFRVTDLIDAKDTRGGFLLAEEIVVHGFDIQDFLSGLEEHFRNLLVVRATGETRLIEASDDVRARYAQAAQSFSEGDILRLLKLTAETAQAVRFSPQPRLKFEVALIGMIKMDSTVLISDLLAGSDQTGAVGAPAKRSSTGAPPQSAQQHAASSSTPARTSWSAPAVVAPAYPGPQLRPADTAKAIRNDERVYARLVRDPSPAGAPEAFAAAVPGFPLTPAHPEDPAHGIPSAPTPAVVQLLIDKLGAVILPNA